MAKEKTPTNPKGAGAKTVLPADAKGWTVIMSDSEISSFKKKHNKPQQYARLILSNESAIISRMNAMQKAILFMDEKGDIMQDTFDIYGDVVKNNPLPEEIENIEFYNKCLED